MASVRKKKRQQTQAPSKKNTGIFLILGGILLLTCFVFSASLENDFLSNWDDDGYIIQNDDIRSLSGGNIKSLFTSYYRSNYQPLTMLGYAIEYQLYELNSKSYHITNLLFHLLNVLLCFHFIRLLTGKTAPAAITAVLFAVHPMHVESVAWISERKDLMYAFFFLGGLITYHQYVNKKKNKLLWWTGGLFICSLLCKSMAVTFPVVLLLIDYYQDRKYSIKVIAEKAPFFLLALAFGIIALLSQSEKAMDIAPVFSWFDRFFLVCYAMAFYVIKLIVPYGFSAIHYYPDATAATLPMLYYLSPVLLLLIGIGLYKMRRHKSIVFGFLFFVVTISVVLQIIPVGQAIVAERYTYVPYIGLFLIIGQLYSAIDEQKIPWSVRIKPWLISVLGVFVLACAIWSYHRTTVWKNSIILFTDVIEKYPDSSHAWWMRGNVKQEYQLYQEAIEDYDRAIQLQPDYAMAYFNRGTAWSALKNYKQAIRNYGQTIVLFPDYTGAYHNMGNALSKQGKFDQAVHYYNKTIEKDSLFNLAWKGGGDALASQGKFREAISYYNRTIEQSPDFFDAFYARGIALYRINEKEKACFDWQRAATAGNQEAIKTVEAYCK